MRLKPTVLATACAVACLVAATETTAKPSKPPAPTYYLALGDSLGQGVQPNAAGKSVETNQGYPDVLYATEKPHVRGLKLVKYACPGESTTSMLHGGRFCKQRPFKGTQLAAAIRFIATHKIAFITLDIGANDVDGCAKPDGSVNGACLTAGLAAVKANAPKIVDALRHAAGPKVRIAGMTYYDPILSEYLGNARQRSTAMNSVAIAKGGLNDPLISAFNARNVRVADVAVAFNTYTPFTTTTTLPRHGTVPLAVAQVCRLTWACTPKPRGPNIHANATGYRKIAGVFAAKL